MIYGRRRTGTVLIEVDSPPISRALLGEAHFSAQPLSRI
jgi:hypothetical protein